jgi:putative ABC transport system ATP-binding protein
VFQQFHLVSTLTALENVMMPLRLLKKESFSRARELLVQVGLESRLNHFPYQLSGGECQRVALARALVTHPPLILADEPSGNLDSETGHQVLDLMFKLISKSRSALILVTHDQELAGRLDKKYVLSGGSLHS